MHPKVAWNTMRDNVVGFAKSHEGQRLMFDLVTLIPVGKAAGVIGKAGASVLEKFGMKGLVKFGAKMSEKFGVKGLASLGEKISQKLEGGLLSRHSAKTVVSFASHLKSRVAAIGSHAEMHSVKLDGLAVEACECAVGRKAEKKQTLAGWKKPVKQLAAN